MVDAYESTYKIGYRTEILCVDIHTIVMHCKHRSLQYHIQKPFSRRGRLGVRFGIDLPRGSSG
jgi:hypothetical protein